MPQTLNVPGVGNIDFPDDATPEQIQDFLDREYNSKQGPQTSAAGAAGRGFLTGLLPSGAAVGTAVGIEALAAPESLGASLLAIPPTLLAGWLAAKGQQKVIHAQAPEFEKLQEADQAQHPWAATAGAVASAAPFARFQPFAILNPKKAVIPAAIGAGIGAGMPLAEGRKPTTQDIVGGIAGAVLFGQARGTKAKAVPSSADAAAAATIRERAAILPNAAREASVEGREPAALPSDVQGAQDSSQPTPSAAAIPLKPSSQVSFDPQAAIDAARAADTEPTAEPPGADNNPPTSQGEIRPGVEAPVTEQPPAPSVPKLVITRKPVASPVDLPPGVQPRPAQPRPRFAALEEAITRTEAEHKPTAESTLTPDEAAYLEQERAAMDQPAEVKVVQADLPDDQPFAHEVATIDRDSGAILVNAKEFKKWLAGVPQAQRQQAIRSLLSEEQIHSRVTNAEAAAYAGSLTALEKAIGKRRYLGPGGWKAPLSETMLGHEMLRYRLQQLARMTPREVAEAARKERWTVQSLTVAESAIRSIRQQMGTRASLHGQAITDRIAANIGAAKAVAAQNDATGQETPAARRKATGKDERQPEMFLGTDMVGGELSKPATAPAINALDQHRLGSFKAPNSFDIDRFGYEALTRHAEALQQAHEAGAKLDKPVTFERYHQALQSKFGPIQRGNALESYAHNVQQMLTNASGKKLEALRKAWGVKNIGEHPIIDPPGRKVIGAEKNLKTPSGAFPAIQEEFSMRRGQAREEIAATNARQKYRSRVMAELVHKMLRPALEDKASMLSSIDPGDVRLPSGETKEPVFWDIDKFDLQHPARLAERLAADARRANTDKVSVTKRVTILTDKLTGETYAVSTYRHGATGAKLVDPRLSGIRNHVSLERLLDRYRPVASVLLDQPVQNFRQKWKSLAAFEDDFGNTARHSNEAAAEPPPHQGGELMDPEPGTGRHRAVPGMYQQKPGSFESRAPMSSDEAMAIIDHIEDQSGTFESPADVQASLSAIAGDIERQSRRAKGRLADTISREPAGVAVRQALSGYRKLAAALWEKYPNASNQEILERLYDLVYENHRHSKDSETYIRRTIEAAGAEAGEAAPTQTGAADVSGARDLTYPPDPIRSRVAPTTLRPEHVPAGSLAERRPAPPVPEGTPGDVRPVERLTREENRRIRQEANQRYRPFQPESGFPGLKSGETETPAAVRKALQDEGRAIYEQVKGMFGKVTTGNDISRLADAADNSANNEGRVAGTAIRLKSATKGSLTNPEGIGGFKPGIRGNAEILSAANAALEAGAITDTYRFDAVQRQRLGDFLQKIANGRAKAQAQIQTGNWMERRIGRAWLRACDQLQAEVLAADRHWDNPEFRETATQMRRELDGLYTKLQNAGVDFTYEPNYLPHRFDSSLWTGKSVIFNGLKVMGKNWRKPRVFDNYYDAIEAGPYMPVTRDGASLVEHAVRSGNSLINRKGWEAGMLGIDIGGGQPLAKQTVKGRGGNWMSPDPVYEVIGKAGQRGIAVHRDYANVVKSLTQPSIVEQFAPARAALHFTQQLKHTLLIGDLFHFARVSYYGAAIMRQRAGWKGGIVVLDIRPESIPEAVRRGVITREAADWGNASLNFGGRRITRRQLADVFTAKGLNVGMIQDALYKDLVTTLTPTAGKMQLSLHRLTDPTVGRYNRFLFDQYTRGLMMESAVTEFERQYKPGMNPDAVVKDIARDVNNFFGNIGRQGLLRSKSWQDLARMFFLAPQWVEGLARKEATAMARFSGATQVTGAMGLPGRKGLNFLGTNGAAVGTGLLAMAALTQGINLIFRKKPTWENEEEGHKLDAWIPAGGGRKEGFWLSPLAVFNELTHDLYRLIETKPKAIDALDQIVGNKESPLARALGIVLTGRTPTGQVTTSTGGTLSAAAQSLVPVPITFGKGMQALGHAMAPNLVRATPPGSTQRMILSAGGLKTEPQMTLPAEMATMARAFMEQNGLTKMSGWQQVQTTEPSFTKLRAALRSEDYPLAQKILEEVGEGRKPSDIIKAMRLYYRRPFTGSRAAELKFIGSMDDRQLEKYTEANEQRMLEFDKFIQWYANQKPGG